MPTFTEDIPKDFQELQKSPYFDYLQTLPNPEVSAIGYSPQKRKNDFIDRYYRSTFKSVVLQNEFSLIKKALNFKNTTYDSLEVIAKFYGIDPWIYSLIIAGDWSGYDHDLLAYNRIHGQNLKEANPTRTRMDTFRSWRQIDTYLRAKSDGEYKAWLIELREEYNREGSLKFPDSQNLENEYHTVKIPPPRKQKRENTIDRHAKMNQAFELHTKVNKLSATEALILVSKDFGFSVSTVERAVGHKK